MGAGASATEVEKSRVLLEDLDRLMQKQRHLMRVAFAHSQRGAALQEERLATHDEFEVAARSIPPGCAAYVWKQDPTVRRVGIRKVFLPHDVREGPRDELLEVVLQLRTSSGAVERDVKASALAAPDSNNDFLADIDGDPFAFDLVHTYAVARMTLDMYIRDLGLPDWRWCWDRSLPRGAPKSPLRIICHAGERPNAVYHRGKRALKFYYYTAEGQSGTTYLCRSFDVVAHETGHAILDALKPALYSIRDGQRGALHESFADLTAIFSVLNQLDICEDVIAETKCDLRKASYITAIGEQFAASSAAGAVVASADATTTATTVEGDDVEVQETLGMRNANNRVRGSECGGDMYQLSNVFTGFVWDVLVALFAWERNPQTGDSDGETLHRVARVVRRIVLLALFGTGEAPDFMELAYGMEKAAEVVCAEERCDVRKCKELVMRARADRELELAGQPRKRRATVDLGHY